MGRAIKSLEKTDTDIEVFIKQMYEFYTQFEARFQFESDIYSSGGHFIYERLSDMTRFSAHYPGDYVEIGCHTGGGTVAIGREARKWGRKLHCIDPWLTGSQNCEGWEYDYFLKNIRFSGLEDTVVIHRLDSTGEEAKELLASLDICMAYVDGLHNEHACYSDIVSVGHTHGPIIVDDISWCRALKNAFLKGARKLDRIHHYSDGFHEGYLCNSPNREEAPLYRVV